MNREVKRVDVSKHPELKAVIEELHSNRIPVVLEEDGEPVAVLLVPDDDSWTGRWIIKKQDPEKIRSFIGIWSDLDADQMIEDIYRWRDEAPPSPDPAEFFDDEHDRDK